MLTQTFDRYRRHIPAVLLVAAAIAAVALSRPVLRSERVLARAAGALPYVIAAIIAVIAVRWIVAATRGRLRALTGVELALTGCIACVCVATLSMSSGSLWTYGMLPYLSLGAGFLLARWFVDCTIARWTLAITGAVVAASVCLDAFAAIGVSPVRRPGGLLGNRNFAGEYIALALPAALVAFTRARRWLAMLVLFGVALALTRCRTAWLAAACAMIAVPALSEAAMRRARVLGAATVLAGVLLATVLPTRLSWHEQDPYAATLARAVDLETGSGALRVRQYATTLRVLDARGAWWTGLGPGSWQSVVRAEDRAIARNRIPHSDYLRVLSDGGVPALAALCITLIVAAAAAWQRRRDNPELCVFIGVLALVALADAPLFRPEVIVIAGAVLAAVPAREPLARGISCRLQPALAHSRLA